MRILSAISSGSIRVAFAGVAAVALFVIGCTAPAGRADAQTRAGTTITNVAQVQATAGDVRVAAASNAATITVAERLDVALSQDGRHADARQATLPATLVNRGNGSEAFAVSASASTGITVRGIAIDGDGDGLFDPAHDTLLNGTTPALDPGASVPLLVLVGGGDPVGSGTITLAARAVTGSGAAGTTFSGVGDGGSDAVVGPTGAEARLALPLNAAFAAAPTLTKSQSVRAPDGSDRPVTGAVVTYTLQATFADARRAVRIDDPIPAGSRYVAGSLTLDGTALTDAADDDPGTTDANGIHVSLGDVAPPPGGVTRTVRFQTILQ